MTLDQLGELPWVVLYNLPTAFAPAAQQLRMLGVEPRVEVVVDGFLPMPFLVAGTDRVALIQERLAAPSGRARRRAGPAVPVRGRAARRGVLVAPDVPQRPGPRLAARRARRGRPRRSTAPSAG